MGENVHDLRKLRGIGRIGLLIDLLRRDKYVLLGGIDHADQCDRIAFRLQIGKAVRSEHIADAGQQQKCDSYQNHPAGTQLFDHFSASSGTPNTRIALQELVTENVTNSHPSNAF